MNTETQKKNQAFSDLADNVGELEKSEMLRALAHCRDHIICDLDSDIIEDERSELKTFIRTIEIINNSKTGDQAAHVLSEMAKSQINFVDHLNRIIELCIFYCSHKVNSEDIRCAGTLLILVKNINKVISLS
jgi:hypothetical protein